MKQPDPPPPPAPDLRDDALARLYRRTAREAPSPRHDAAVLAAAAADLARPPGGRPQRWHLALSLAFTVILSAGLVVLVEREQDRRQHPEVAPPTPAAQTPAPAVPGVAPPATPQARDIPAEEGRLAAPIHPSPRPAAPHNIGTDGSKRPPPSYNSQDAARPAPPAVKAGAAPGTTADAAAPATAPPATQAASSREKPGAAPAAREAATPTPEAQLAKIRALLQAGREEEARAELAAFRRTHPEFPLPADLEALQPDRK